MSDGTWRSTDFDSARRIGEELDDTKELSTAFTPPETFTILENKVTARVRKTDQATPYEPLIVGPPFDIWSNTVCFYSFVAHKPLFPSDDRDNVSSKQELMRLATWGPRSLAEALADAKAALVADGVDKFVQIEVGNLLGWGLQWDPANRPQSCKEILAHCFFAQCNEGVEEGKADEIETKEAGEVTEAQVFSLAEGLSLTTPLHVAAELGGPLSLFDAPSTTAAALISKYHCVGKTPLHLAAAGAHVQLVQRLLKEPTVDAGALDWGGLSPLDDVEAMLEQNIGDAGLEARLWTVRGMLVEADIIEQVKRQTKDGVTREEGQVVRNLCQSQVDRPIEEYWPRVIISYATGTRDKWHGHEQDLNGEGCGLGMQYCQIVVRQLERAGIQCFSGLHVAGGNNWRIYFEKLQRADVMLAIMSPAFFESGPCFEEQIEARRHGLKVIPLLFQLEEDGSPPGSKGGQKWVDEYEGAQAQSEVAHDTLASFRVGGARFNVDSLKLNSEPAPPGTMLDSALLEKLVGTVKRLLDEKDTAAANGASLQQLAVAHARIAELEAENAVLAAAAAAAEGAGLEGAPPLGLN